MPGQVEVGTTSRLSRYSSMAAEYSITRATSEMNSPP